MREWYQRKTAEERRAWVARRDPEKVKAADRARHARHRDARNAANRMSYYEHWDERRESDRISYYENHDARKEEHRKYKEDPAARAERTRSYRERYPERYKATTAVNNAIRDGRLERGECEICGKRPAEAHHEDYAKPFEIRWLCKDHHAETWRRHPVGVALSHPKLRRVF